LAQLSPTAQRRATYLDGLIFITVFIITGAGNAINDYFDAGIDAINRPDAHTIGRISKNSAYRFSIALFAAGIVISYFIGSSIFLLLIAIFNSFLLYFYASFLKRKVFVGNLSVSYLHWFNIPFREPLTGKRHPGDIDTLFPVDACHICA